MINLSLNKDQGYVILSINGPISVFDMENLTDEVDHYIEDFGKLAGLIIMVKKFPGWDNLDSFFHHVKFVKDHHKLISKVGFMTEDNLIKSFPSLANHFVKAELKRFDDGQMDEAVEWICSH
ncbi:STAS/SEC14 domain-containing protein [Reichenbachiella carrageenanivorans]|uniref:STAS/SEC14 domain-containing protein n=1 Tax=Reichenbachiella carrageenanivorans TaxID=2979869 RepID=A0ABY6CZS6_9BACT|nr:STAS/SEC14 domain-containing protein [Reichenbachiella carrageenanivorans]UXX78303.1 STAS/SEC14 domain-containing protein [Reichenbachiella carrageenanivorans]